MNFTLALAALFWMLAWHAVADYSLQTDFVAKGKNRTSAWPGIPWQYVMAAHCLTHAAGVAAVVLWLTPLSPAHAVALGAGCFELATHWLLDCMKCEGAIGFHEDQLGHFATKFAVCVLTIL